ncbi:MAG: HAMP domain-containing sensor histidine kinase [Lawsonibacter sp.]|nr:HAMP domain-containing sensor histidine kinase [Lawsonibacter sp.]
MGKLQKSTAGKILATIFFLTATFSGAMCFFQLLTFLSFADTNSWQETDSFHSLLLDRESMLADYFANTQMLEQNQDLTYMEQQQLQDSVQALRTRMDDSVTWFRFQVLSSDGQEVLYSNLKDGESLPETVDSVQYATFQLGETEITSDFIQYSNSLMFSIQPSDADSQAKLSESSSPTTLVIECGAPLQVTDGSIQDEFSSLALQYTYSQTHFLLLTTLGLLFLALSLACLCYLLWTAGHKSGVDGIVLTWQERIFFDLYLIIMMTAGTALFAGAMSLGEYISQYFYNQAPESEQFLLPAAAAASALSALFLGVVTLTLRTLVVRCKAHMLIQTTFALRVLRFLWRTVRDFIRNLPLTWRVVSGFLIYLLLELFSWELRYSVGLLLLLLVHAAVLFLLCWWTVSFRRLRIGSQAIAAGNLNHQIDTLRMPHDLKAYAEDLNNISVGLSSAVDEKMKSERFKAELITNVSHDLKTPLTSIINYVNLLKTTQQTDKTAQEYIEVLDRKSLRLKKLTEDLVEASKASTGVLSVNREKIGMAQLIDQALGEWAEKLEARTLTVVPSLPEGETWVYADGRHLWRVIDNLLSNCAKYAMEGTRIYLDLSRGHGHVVLSVKNISRDALNVSPERLLERFVQGDESRTTEGSGLGLSIARSLTELQGGTFGLTVDGDLFKATVTLPQAN